MKIKITCYWCKSLIVEVLKTDKNGVTYYCKNPLCNFTGKAWLQRRDYK